MASPWAALSAALAGLLVWMTLGWWIACRLGWSRSLGRAVAPALGWAVQTSLALGLSLTVGLTVVSMLASVLLIVGACWLLPVNSAPDSRPQAVMPAWVFLAAAIVALLPTLALLPKHGAAGVLLASPMFDHSKIALIDQMIREGVPPANPVFAEDPHAGVAYYYLWHFGAAQLGRVTGASGWEADIAAGWFSAFASLTLMCGLAFHLRRGFLAPVFVLVACVTGSLREAISLVVDQEQFDRIVEPATGLGGWLFQSTWSPHHVASATCAVLVALLLEQLASRATILVAIVLGLVLAAGFQSSIWVGGVVVPLAAIMTLAVILTSAAKEQRARILVGAIAAIFVAVLLSAPLLLEQMSAAAARGGGIPIRVAPQYVLGAAFPAGIRRLLDVPAYWLVLLVLELPVVLIAGLTFLVRHLSRRQDSSVERIQMQSLAFLAATSLCCGWWLFSTTGDNNDLGWRAVLPGVLVLTGTAGAGFADWFARRSYRIVAALVGSIVLAVPGGIALAVGNSTGMPSISAAQFEAAPDMWAAVRRHTPTDGRVANNPQLFGDLTPWPVNISWALLANRRSCFAGNELALAFAPLSPLRRAEIAERFDRVFAGGSDVEETSLLAREYRCTVVLVTSQDGAWLHDPFATNANFQLVESRANAWRIYTVQQ